MKRILVVIALSWLLPACGKDIGDDCQTNVDCAEDGTRTCDLAQPGGYCTVDGCDQSSCPSESVCVRFFPYKFPTGSCSASSSSECSSEDICLPEGLCVPRTSERRFCAVKCGGNGDCRGGYVCRETGVNGALALLPNPDAQAKFCAPEGQ